MNSPSLILRVRQISMGAFLASIAVVLAGFIFFSTFKRDLAEREITKELERNSVDQVEQLIPSFLLPEQNEGVELLLSKFKRIEELAEIQIIQTDSQIPKKFRSCQLTSEKTTSCQSVDGRETALIIPISEVGHDFGYLLKAKHNSNSWAVNDTVEVMIFFALALCLTFVGIYSFIARLLSRTMPRALDQLVEWIESDLSDRDAAIRKLPFAELESLREKISEVMERYNLSREQAVIGQLAGGIIHDIKTPLQSIVTALHLLKDQPDVGQKRIDRLENLAAMCRMNIPVMGEIIETTLDGTRNIHISKETLNIEDTLQNAISTHSQMAELRETEIDFISGEKVLVSHDPVQMGRVFGNLIRNAIEAASLATRSPRVRVSLQQEEKNVTVIVEDSGEGIKASPEKIFRAFRSSKARGSGLGLLISKKIVDAHFGIIRASSGSILGGAKFEVVLAMASSTLLAGQTSC